MSGLSAAHAAAAPANDGKNEYEGYDIAGSSQAKESPYGTVRDWTVVSATVAGHFAYCAGEFRDRRGIWRLGWDGLQWQIGLLADEKPDWSGQLNVDGDKRSISGTAKNGWTFLWLGMQDLEKIRTGTNMTVAFAKSSIDRDLVGTAAVITKIEECVNRKGKGTAAKFAAPARSP